ncbi:hypothetical protein APP86_22125 [Salmonella enterica subsp. houtenae]|nr:hypothetical protein APP86_22125 [Salmonella enterica subsp. houtenae]
MAAPRRIATKSSYHYATGIINTQRHRKYEKFIRGWCLYTQMAMSGGNLNFPALISQKAIYWLMRIFLLDY